jgi:integrase
MARDNCWYRHIGPKIKAAGLEGINYQVMRRTHSSLMRGLNVDPKVVADQLGHTLDVDLNVYTATALETRKQAVNSLDPGQVDQFDL